MNLTVDGAWSVWSGWSDCSVPCGVSQRRRTRSCSSPSAVNGGKPCVGEFVDTVQCFPSCPGETVLGFRHHVVFVCVSIVPLFVCVSIVPLFEMPFGHSP